MSTEQKHALNVWRETEKRQSKPEQIRIIIHIFGNIVMKCESMERSHGKANGRILKSMNIERNCHFFLLAFF